ncbi:MAG: hypothetical protein FWG00_06630 [Coriobacteriia bacterium]|nr:hypothetical protein [Coriobacteriia bacterium]MDR2714033.1 hypothetical protein [Coriobacteriales bacterium]
MLSFLQTILTRLPDFVVEYDLGATADGSEMLFLVGAALFLAGPIYYMIMYARYRNQDQRHYHEKETSAQMDNLQVSDVFVKQETGKSSSRISGENSSQVSGSLVKGAGSILQDTFDAAKGSIGRL